MPKFLLVYIKSKKPQLTKVSFSKKFSHGHGHNYVGFII